MVRKCVRNLPVLIMEVLILIVLNVQANDLASTSFYPSSPPILLPYSFELDRAKGDIHECLTNEIEGCKSSKTTWPSSDIKYSYCIFRSFKKCLNEFPRHPIMRPIIKDCFLVCAIKLETEQRYIAGFTSCLLKCYEEHVKKPSDVIYMQNPWVLAFDVVRVPNLRQYPFYWHNCVSLWPLKLEMLV